MHYHVRGYHGVVNAPSILAPGLVLRPAAFNGYDTNGKPIPLQSIISSPNVDTIPDVSVDEVKVRVRTDGRFYTSDFGLFPQWFFKENPHLPYISVRPSDNELDGHRYRFAWYDMKQADFLPEQGSASKDIGLLKPQIVSEFTAMRTNLEKEIKAFTDRNEYGYSANDYKDLMHSTYGMKSINTVLLRAPQSFNHTLLSVCTFQRYFLESLAIFDYLRYWKRPENFVDNEPLPVRHDLMGIFTHQLSVAQDLYKKGVPVWLVRRPEDLPRNMNIRSAGRFVVPENLVKDVLPGFDPVWDDIDMSPLRIKSVYRIKDPDLHLGHTSFRKCFDFVLYVLV